MAEMRTQIAKLAEKPVQAPSTQSIDNLWGKLPKRKFGKRKQKAEESEEELPTDLSKEERRQEKKVRKASRKAEREKSAREQQQRDDVLAGASGNGAPAPTSEDQPDQVPSSKSAPIDKGANADPKIDA
ncbi:hypothetical protein KY284_007892 [Solanum tuberosum]|nr:hypothetical protein KY284_007892 [Solanum tuberosum]